MSEVEPGAWARPECPPGACPSLRSAAFLCHLLEGTMKEGASMSFHPFLKFQFVFTLKKSFALLSFGVLDREYGMSDFCFKYLWIFLDLVFDHDCKCSMKSESVHNHQL